MSAKDADFMAKILRMASGESKTNPTDIASKRNADVSNGSVSNNDFMKRILNKVYETQEKVTPPITESKPTYFTSDTSKPVSQDLSSKYIKVELYPGSKTRKLYSVMESNGEEIHRNIFTFEAAQLILEKYEGINNYDVSEILSKDKEYNDKIKESIFYKQKVKTCKELNESKAERILLEKANKSLRDASTIQNYLRKKIS